MKTAPTSRRRALCRALCTALASCGVLGVTPALAQNAVVSLGDLDGSNGFRLDGIAAGDYSGYAVSAAGDIDGDGFDDTLVGAARTDINGYYSGSSYVVFGGDGPFPASMSLADLDGQNGFRLDGPRVYMEAGRSVAGAGDVNGDGFDDLLIGAPFDYASGDYSGSSYVVFGHARPFPVTLDLDDVDGESGFRIDGSTPHESSGFSVAAADDINGDGFHDIVIGAPFASHTASQSGSSYVVFGHADNFPARLSLDTLEGSNGFRLDGVAAYDNSGRSVAGGGDINGDGIDDLLIGAHLSSAGASYAGSAYVLFGRTSHFPATINLADLDGSNGFRIDGAAVDDNAGFSVSCAGDVNADGIEDIIIGSDNAAANGAGSGSAHVVFGHAGAFPAVIGLANLDGVSGFRVNGANTGDFAGNRVSAAGDVNGDGIADILIGAPGADPHDERSGSSYVVFGRMQTFPATFELSAVDGHNGFRIDGEAAFDSSGASVSRGGDVNGDGIDDFVIGAFGADAGGMDTGATYVVFGTLGDRVFCNGFDVQPCSMAHRTK